MSFKISNEKKYREALKKKKEEKKKESEYKTLLGLKKRESKSLGQNYKKYRIKYFQKTLRVLKKFECL